jgi:hypothetical protein
MVWNPSRFYGLPGYMSLNSLNCPSVGWFPTLSRIIRRFCYTPEHLDSYACPHRRRRRSCSRRRRSRRTQCRATAQEEGGCGGRGWSCARSSALSGPPRRRRQHPEPRLCWPFSAECWRGIYAISSPFLMCETKSSPQSCSVLSLGVRLSHVDSDQVAISHLFNLSARTGIASSRRRILQATTLI